MYVSAGSCLMDYVKIRKYATSKNTELFFGRWENASHLSWDSGSARQNKQ